MFCGSAPAEDCIEPDFTVKGSREWDRKQTPAERREVLFVPAKFRYLQPPQKDPLVDPEWPLAEYWPVYLSNFMVHDWLDQHWYMLVSDFFAYYGFQTRMIYFHLLDTEYMRVQKKNLLIEALVYFGSEEECERAMATCHRKQYLGHRLNVLPGRTPEYFCNERSVRFVRKGCQQAESFFELSLIPFGKVELVIRHAEGNILVQFHSVEDMIKALPSQTTWKPVQLNGPVRVQRFLESDVKMGIKWVIESEERFLVRRPRPKILQYFEDGIHPIVENTWMTHSVPKASKTIVRDKKAIRTRLRQLAWKKFHKKNVEKYMKSEEYQKLSESEKKAVCEDFSKKYGFDPTAPKKPKGGGLTRRQKQASVLNSINYLMRQNGQPTLKKADQDEKRIERNKALQLIKDAAKVMD